MCAGCIHVWELINVQGSKYIWRTHIQLPYTVINIQLPSTVINPYMRFVGKPEYTENGTSMFNL